MHRTGIRCDGKAVVRLDFFQDNLLLPQDLRGIARPPPLLVLWIGRSDGRGKAGGGSVRSSPGACVPRVAKLPPSHSKSDFYPNKLFIVSTVSIECTS